MSLPLTVPQLTAALSHKYKAEVKEHYVRKEVDFAEARGASVERLSRTRMVSPKVAKEVESELLRKGLIPTAEEK